MFFDQLCTAFDTQPRKLLRAGHILPSCPPAPALQPGAWVPRSTALRCMLCSTVSCLRCLDIHKSGCKVLAGGSQYSHILYAPPAMCNRAEGDFPGGNLEENWKESCIPAIACQKKRCRK